MKEKYRIFIAYGKHNPAYGFNIAWLLHDPLLVQDIMPDITFSSTQTTDEGVNGILSEECLERYDLVIIPHMEDNRLTVSDEEKLVKFLYAGGKVFADCPELITGEPAGKLLSAGGIQNEGWYNNPPVYSAVTKHPAAKISGLSPGETAFFHTLPGKAIKLITDNADILTELNEGTLPDIVISKKIKLCVTASPCDDIIPCYYWLRHPRCMEYRARQNYLIINALRRISGLDFIFQPANQSQMEWSEKFYAYACGKYFLHSSGNSEMINLTVESDKMIYSAAASLKKGYFPEASFAFGNAVRLLSECSIKYGCTRNFIFRGWHASLLYDEYRDGNLVGYAECADTDWLFHWMEEQLSLARRSDSPRVNDICPSTWEILNKYYPERVAKFANAHAEGIIEAAGGHYTQAYMQIIPEECNIRQITYGRNALGEVLGVFPVVWLCADDHFNFHPQMPQILKDFGYRYAVLRGHAHTFDSASDEWLHIGPGIFPRMQERKIWWRGLDRTEIETVTAPSQKVNFAKWWKAEPLEAAENKDMLFGQSIDATHDEPAEREHTLLSGTFPVAGKFTTCENYFIHTPAPQCSRFLGVDDLWGIFPQKWTGLGWLNAGFARNRIMERLLLYAERFHAIAVLYGLQSREEELSDAWKNLLLTQDHLSFGPSKHIAGETGWQSTAGYYTKIIPNWPGADLPVSCPGIAEKTAELSARTAEDILDFSLEFLTACIDNPLPDSYRCGQSMLIVFNPLMHSRKDAVIAEVRENGIQSVTFDGKIFCPAQLITADEQKNQLLFIADVPSFGYSASFVSGRKASVNAGLLRTDQLPMRMENEHFIIEIDGKQGGITRLVEKSGNLELLNPGAHLLGELVSTDSPVSSSRGPAELRVLETGPIRTAVEIISGTFACSSKMTVYLYAGIPRIDLDIELDYGKEASFGFRQGPKITPEKTGLFAVFPFLSAEEIFLHQPFGFYPVQRSPNVTLDILTLVYNTHQVLISQSGSPLFWHENGTIWFGLAQGQPPMSGKHKFSWAITVKNGNLNTSDSLRFAQEINNPLAATYKNTTGGNWQMCRSFIRSSTNQTLLTAFYQSGCNFILRFFEADGKFCREKLISDLPVSDWQEISLDGKKKKETKNIMQIEPWKIKTLCGQIKQ